MSIADYIASGLFLGALLFLAKHLVLALVGETAMRREERARAARLQLSGMGRRRFVRYGR